jgi:hypothetical protein
MKFLLPAGSMSTHHASHPSLDLDSSKYNDQIGASSTVFDTLGKADDCVQVISFDYCSGFVMGEISVMKLPKKVFIPCISNELADAVNGSFVSFKFVMVCLI